MHFTFCLDGGSVFFMAAKAEVLEKQIPSRAAKIDLISLDRCADASVS